MRSIDPSTLSHDARLPVVCRKVGGNAVVAMPVWYARGKGSDLRDRDLEPFRVVCARRRAFRV